MTTALFLAIDFRKSARKALLIILFFATATLFQGTVSTQMLSENHAVLMDMSQDEAPSHGEMAPMACKMACSSAWLEMTSPDDTVLDVHLTTYSGSSNLIYLRGQSVVPSERPPQYV